MRWLLLLVLVHTVPVIWITPVAAATAPTMALLGYAIASLFTLDHQAIALGLFALLPGLLFAGIGWVLAWLLGKAFRLVPRPIGAGLLACLTVGLLVAAIHFPIYIVGGHNSSSSSDLFGLFVGAINRSTLMIYSAALHCVLATLFVGSLLRDDHAFVAYGERWRRPFLATASATSLGILVYHNHALFLCRPFAELGVGSAQVCVAKSAGHDRRYWYERAAARGNAEAIAWLIDETPNRTAKLKWLRMGAEAGDPAIQCALYRFLSRTQGPDARTEAEHLLQLSAEAGHAEAQMELVERLTRELHRSESRELLAERNAWLDRAAERGSRTAKLRLAQHYTEGSMGHPVDFERARAFLRELIASDDLEKYEMDYGLNAAAYQQRLDELDTWEAGLAQRDAAVVKAVAERLLASRLPGPGVSERGIELLEQLASAGDTDVRDELIVMLRTGTGGADKDLDAAKGWLVKAAEAGSLDAMERLANNYMSGREGFPIDYPEARRWIEAQIAIYAERHDKDAQARVRKLRQDVAYIDRLGGYARGTMLGSDDLAKLGQNDDSQSQYEHAIQLLVGHGSKRRAEAIAGLHEAARQGHGGAAWRLFQVYDRGFPAEIDKVAAMEQLELAVANHHFDATRELAENCENGKRGLAVDLPRAIALYEGALEAGHDNRYGWNLDPSNFYHFKWLESRLRQARMKLNAQERETLAGR